jgi:hypothetical protein
VNRKLGCLVEKHLKAYVPRLLGIQRDCCSPDQNHGMIVALGGKK